MAVMRYTIVDKSGTVSFIAPWNTLKALIAGCSRKPGPQTLTDLLEAASKYDTGLQDYVLNGLAVFDEHHERASEEGTVQLSPELEKELQDLLSQTDLPDPPSASQVEIEESQPEISYAELLQQQSRLSGSALSKHPVLRVFDAQTRQESLEPVRIGLVIFNLTAHRIIQVQNSYGVLKRSDRGRYFEDGQPTERLYFYRLPSDWSLLP